MMPSREVSPNTEMKAKGSYVLISSAIPNVRKERISAENQILHEIGDPREASIYELFLVI